MIDHSPVARKKVKSQKYQKNSLPDFSYWTDEQRLRYSNAKNELERENILGEMQMKREDELLNNQILQHKQGVKKDDLDDFSFSNSEQDDSAQQSEEEGEVRNEKAHKIKKQMDQEVLQKAEVEEKVDLYEKAIRDVTIKRQQIEYFLMNVFYNNVIEGAFVRIQEPQLKKYALAQILAVLEGDQPYQVGDITTYKILKLQIAEIKEPKFRHITLVSNQKIETQEYILWKKSREDAGQTLPPKEQLSKKSRDIQRAFQVKLSDEQIEKKIVTTVEEWCTQTKPQIYFNDIPYYETFLQNQMKTQRQTLDRLDEFIHEITESQQESDTIRQEDTNKLIMLKRQQTDCRDRIQFLNNYVDKIKLLYQKHRSKEQNKNKNEPQYSNSQISYPIQSIIKQEYSPTLQLRIDNSQGRALKLQENIEKMKLMDKVYLVNQFSEVVTFNDNTHIKEQFLQKHQWDLEIDQIIDGFVLEEL